jgi:hypothetical protein
LPAALALPLFAMKIPEMIVPYADTASVILASVQREGPMSKKRIGIALPVGMRGKKDLVPKRPDQRQATGARSGGASRS